MHSEGLDPAPGPASTIAAQQDLDQVVRILMAVSLRTCQILIAQREGYSYEDIAIAFAIKPLTVEKRVATRLLLPPKRMHATPPRLNRQGVLRRAPGLSRATMARLARRPVLAARLLGSFHFPNALQLARRGQSQLHFDAARIQLQRNEDFQEEVEAEGTVA